MADNTNPQDRPLVTRAQAKTAGLTRYFTGKPCPRGHIAERRVSARACVVCSVADRAALRKARPEVGRISQAAYHAANREKSIANSAAWRAANRELMLSYGAAYRAANRALRTLHEGNRRARKRQASGKYFKSDISSLLKQQRGKCAHPWCKKPLSSNYHVDHIIPLSMGGSNGRTNLQLLCPSCNMKKGRSHPIDFALRHGMLL